VKRRHLTSYLSLPDHLKRWLEGRLCVRRLIEKPLPCIRPLEAVKEYVTCHIWRALRRGESMLCYERLGVLYVDASLSLHSRMTELSLRSD
jgi:hypothetical protein